MSQPLKKQRTSRRGSVYVAVLGVALIVAVIGISSVHVARVETRQAVLLDEMARARLAAISGVECVLAKIKSDPQWRQNYNNGATNVVGNLTAALGLSGMSSQSFEFTLTDTDGDLADNPEDWVTIRSVGLAGKTRHVIEVLLQPTGENLSCLGASLHADGDIIAQGSVTTNQIVSSNSNIDASHGSASITGNAQAVGMVLGNVSGQSSPGMTPPLEMPDSESVFKYYEANGTHIDYSELAGGAIDRVILSPGNNPYGAGATNHQGIYVINCRGNQVTITNSRIQATLLFLNASAGVELKDSIHWQPTIANFPALLVQGDVAMNWSGNLPLREDSVGVNFNPPHTPYEGISDGMIDSRTYPSTITGIVYVTGHLRMSQQTKIEGVVIVGGTVQTQGYVNLTYKNTYLSNAPPGFASGTEMKLVPGTWKQVPFLEP